MLPMSSWANKSILISFFVVLSQFYDITNIKNKYTTTDSETFTIAYIVKVQFIMYRFPYALLKLDCSAPKVIKSYSAHGDTKKTTTTKTHFMC